MKLRIELDFRPEEVDLVTELVATLRAITDHVTINAGSPPAQAPVALQPAAKEPALPGTQLSGAQEKATTPSPSPPPRPAAVQPAQPAKKEAPPVPPFNRTSAVSVASKIAVKPKEGIDFGACISAYQIAAEKRDEPACKKIANEIIAALPTRIDSTSPSQDYVRFVEVLEDKLLVSRDDDNSLVAETCQLLTELPDDMMNDLKTRIISTALKHLMIKRSISASRREIFAHAEVFAAMVQLEFILISGAVQTISKLMKKEETRTAAVTMLGATTAVCSEQLLTQVDEMKLSALRTALSEVIEPELNYDKKYIEDALQWNKPHANGHAQTPNGTHHEAAPAAAPQAAPNSIAQPSAQVASLSAPGSAPAPAPTPVPVPIPTPATVPGLLRVEPKAQWGGYDLTVKGIAVDDKFGQIVSTCNDGTIRLHSVDGDELQRIELKPHLVVDLDFNSYTRVVACACGPMLGSAAEPVYRSFQIEDGSLIAIGKKDAPSSIASLLKLRFLARGSAEFIAAETSDTKRLIVSRYSLERLRGLNEGSITPLASFETDHTMITAISAIPTSALAYLTADRTGKIYIWNVKSPTPGPVITLTPPEPAEGAHPNAGVITCLDTLEPNIVLAGTYGQGVNVWDLKQLARGKKDGGLAPCATIPLVNEAVTRMARLPSAERQTVVATATSIFTLKLNEDGSFNGRRDGKKASPRYYWDAKWGSYNGVQTLYAASAGPPGAVDVYKVS